MSVLTYAALTNKREQAGPGTSTTSEPPGVRTYVDAFAALVPAEVLTLHALIVSFTTTTRAGKTSVSDPGVLEASFWGLVALAVVLYVAPRLIKGSWDRFDFLRALIPPLAFVGWTMLQRTTAFDAVAPDLSLAARTVLALFLGVGLGIGAAALAFKSDQKTA